jgi:transcriptional regulator with GAF, ATPase, and Fis domain
MYRRETVLVRVRSHGRRPAAIVEVVRTALAEAGVEVVTGAGASPAQRPAGSVVDLVCFETVTPAVEDQIRTAAHLRSRCLAVGMLTVPLSRRDTWTLLGLGASDVVSWRGPATAHDLAARLERWSGVDAILESPLVRTNLVGSSAEWTRVLRELIEVASFTDTSVLLTGESGTGKELVARLIHSLDRREDKGELVILDCTTVVPTLSGSEFFGHERGAFTGAVAARDGAFARANGGTLFLDEVGELPLTLQAELLRVIQEGQYKRVGGDTWRRTQFRLVCATNRSLGDAQATGTFRKDLYHRIAAWSCELPPLRDRAADILPLARHFLSQILRTESPPELDPHVAALLEERPYGGNVRELRLLMTRIAARHVGGGPITVGDLPESERTVTRAAAIPDAPGWERALEAALLKALDQGVSLVEIGRLAKVVAVRLALADAGGDTHAAAERLKVSERALQLRRASARGADERAD